MHEGTEIEAVERDWALDWADEEGWRCGLDACGQWACSPQGQTAKAAYEAAIAAAEAKYKAVRRCPYPAGSKEADCWIDGWEESWEICKRELNWIDTARQVRIERIEHERKTLRVVAASS
jgi:hypothetical protein